MPILHHPFTITFATIVLPMLMQLFYIRYASYYIDKSILGEFVLLQMFVVALSYTLLQVPVQSFKRFYNVASDKNEFINEFKSLVLFVNVLCLLFVIIYGVIFPRFDPIALCMLVVYFWLLSSFSLGQQVFLLRLERGRYFKLKLLEAFAKFIAPLIIYSIYQTMESLLAGLVVGYSVATLAARIYDESDSFRYVFKRFNVLKYLNFAYPMLFVSFFSWGISFSDRYFIEYFMSSYDVGVYAILSSVAGLGTVVGQLYSTYVNPKVLKTYEESRNESLQYLKKSLCILAIFFVLVCCIAFLIPNVVWSVLIEPEILAHRTYLATFYVLIISVCLTVFQTALSMYINLFKRLDILIAIYAAAFIANLLGNLFIGVYGVFAAAVSTVVAYLIILTMQFVCIVRLQRFNSCLKI